MTSRSPLLRNLKAPSPRLGLVLASLLMAAACATAPTRPPVSIGSGQPRVDPVTGEAIGPSAETTDEALNKFVRGDGGLTPGFMAGKEVKRAAVLLPFSHPNAQVRAEAEAMLAGIELALFENGGTDFLLLPKDTAGRSSTAEARADEALDEGADIILGPLFGTEVPAVKDVALRKSIPVIAFSNDRKVAGGGSYLASVMPEEEVVRIMGYAASRATRTFAFLGPDTAYGRQVEAAMRAEAAENGWTVLGTAFYDPGKSASSEVSRIAGLIKAEPSKVGLLIPERGTKLLSIAPLLVVNGIDPGRTRFLGTSIWDDSSIWREPALAGAWFSAIDPDNLGNFNDTFKRIYGRAPTDLAAAAYDAASLAITLAAENNMKHGGVTDPDGFMGVNGLFRFRLDGTSERGLAVKQISASGAPVVEDGVTRFPPGGS